jgi:hypothetical protein
MSPVAPNVTSGTKCHQWHQMSPVAPNKAEGGQLKSHMTLSKMAHLLHQLNFFRLFHRQKLRKIRIAYLSTGQKLQHQFVYFTWFVDSLISHQCQFAFLPPTRFN